MNDGAANRSGATYNSCSAPARAASSVARRLERQQRVQRRRPDAAPRQVINLILHQRDERRHHDRDARQQHRGQLEAERLAGSGRHHREHVAAVQHGAHERLLAGAKRRVSEVPPPRLDHMDHA
jgi:hypothetical protein